MEPSARDFRLARIEQPVEDTQDVARMTAALQLDILDVIIVSETMTGTTGAALMATRIEGEITQGNILRLDLRTAPQDTVKAWVLDDPVLSVLDATTILGFA